MQAIKREMELISGSYVLVGFQEGTVTKSQTKDKRRKKAGLSIPQIAAQNEFGTRIIPARPFMRPAFDENREKLNKAIAGEYTKITEGRSTVKKSLSLLGEFMVGKIKMKIRSIQTPPNSPRTIAEKKSSKPLIDFGQMIQSVQSKVVIG
jgi:hypothetical protein